MIYTLTLNPALDYTVIIDELQRGKIILSDSQYMAFGGKGINVSLVLKELEMPSVAMGFAAGFVGYGLIEELENKGISHNFVMLQEGNSRINVKIRDGEETDINTLGPNVPSEALDELFCKLDRLKSGDVLVLAGTVPPLISKNIYADIMKRLENKGVLFVVDAIKETLLSSLEFKPFLIKPNAEELGDIFDTEIKSFEDALFYAEKLQQMGAQNVLVSMGEKGAALKGADGKEYTINAPRIIPKSTVAAGDSTVAGFLAGYLKTDDLEYALKLGVACGTATASRIGTATREEIEKFCK
ncbi:MAG: 1-phosphofructokinase [Clostridia bacterium]|nr:1-phosphofructokinase [Clostridia bacterium]